MESRQAYAANDERRGPATTPGPSPAIKVPYPYVHPGNPAPVQPQPVPGTQPPSGKRPVAPPEVPQEEGSVWGMAELALVVAIILGAAAAALSMPVWLPVLGQSVVGADVKAYWYLSRASGLTAFVLLWVSMASGLIITNKMARIWPGAFTAFDLHQFTSLLGLGFMVFHALILLGNAYVPYNLAQLLIPFAGAAYRPLWVGIGQIAIYLCILVTFTFYVRKQISNRLWHIIHYLSYAVFALTLAHSLFSGTDSNNPWIFSLYWLTTASLVVLTAHRLLRRPELRNA
ncbi:MAG: hypothetical protein ACJ78Q_05240 [Chloroflexia bacterium]